MGGTRAGSERPQLAGERTAWEEPVDPPGQAGTDRRSTSSCRFQSSSCCRLTFAPVKTGPAQRSPAGGRAEINPKLGGEKSATFVGDGGSTLHCIRDDEMAPLAEARGQRPRRACPRDGRNIFAPRAAPRRVVPPGDAASGRPQPPPTEPLPRARPRPSPADGSDGGPAGRPRRAAPPASFARCPLVVCALTPACQASSPAVKARPSIRARRIFARAGLPIRAPACAKVLPETTIVMAATIDRPRRSVSPDTTAAAVLFGRYLEALAWDLPSDDRRFS